MKKRTLKWFGFFITSGLVTGLASDMAMPDGRWRYTWVALASVCGVACLVGLFGWIVSYDA